MSELRPGRLTCLTLPSCSPDILFRPTSSHGSRRGGGGGSDSPGERAEEEFVPRRTRQKGAAEQGKKTEARGQPGPDPKWDLVRNRQGGEAHRGGRRCGGTRRLCGISVDCRRPEEEGDSRERAFSLMKALLEPGRRPPRDADFPDGAAMNGEARGGGGGRGGSSSSLLLDLSSIVSTGFARVVNWEYEWLANCVSTKTQRLVRVPNSLVKR